MLPEKPLLSGPILKNLLELVNGAGMVQGLGRAQGYGPKRQEAEEILGLFDISSETRGTRDRDQELSSP